MIHTCGWSREFAYDPNTEYRFEAIEEDGRQNSQNALKYIIGGPCSSWTGHAGYCWNKTMADNRPHAATWPDGGGPEVRSELDGYILPRIPVYRNNIRTAR